MGAILWCICLLLFPTNAISNSIALEHVLDFDAHISNSIAQVNAKIRRKSQDSAIAELDSLTLILFQKPDSSMIRYGFDIGSAHRSLHRYETAASVYHWIVKISETTGDSISLSRSLYYLGQSYKNLGLLNKGLEHLYRGLSISIAQGDISRSCLIQSQIGIIKKDQGLIDEAISYFNDALEKSLELNDEGMVAAVYNNLGSAYKMSGYYAQAKEFFLKAIEINKRINHEQNLSYNYNNLANIFEETGDLDNAINYQLKSIELKQKIDDFPMLSISYSNMALIYIKKGDYESAESFVLKALDLAKAYQVAAALPVIYSQYAIILSKKGEYKAAFEVMNDLNDFKDSLAVIDKEVILSEMEAKYKRQSILNENALLKKDEAITEAKEYQKKTFMFILIICSALLVLTSVLYYFLFRSKVSANEMVLSQKETIAVQDERMNQLKEKLTSLMSTLENVKKDKEAFFTTMSHDMKGPISALISIVGSLKKEPESIQKEEIQILDYSTRSLLGLVEDALDFSNIESGRLHIEHRAFSLTSIITDTCASFAFISNEKEIDLIIELNDLPEQLLGDPKRIGQILFNLIGNAFKFTKEGYVKISANSVKQEDGRELIEILIEDSGLGIPQSKLDVIFHKFEQTNARVFKDFGGNGLGLYIVKALINQMGGSIHVESKVNEGTTFLLMFSLPIA